MTNKRYDRNGKNENGRQGLQCHQKNQVLNEK